MPAHDKNHISRNYGRRASSNHINGENPITGSNSLAGGNQGGFHKGDDISSVLMLMENRIQSLFKRADSQDPLNASFDRNC